MKSLTESIMNESSTMSLAKEMELWAKRGADPFGKPLNAIVRLLKNYEVSSPIERGVDLTASQMLVASYEMDGNKKDVTRRMLRYLANYDYIYINDNGALSSHVDGLLEQLQLLTIQAKFTSDIIKRIVTDE